jgi:uncharacterized protein (DUF433 family)
MQFKYSSYRAPTWRGHSCLPRRDSSRRRSWISTNGILRTLVGARVFDRITFNPQIMGGRACIRGMRITVSLLINLVANNMSTEEILREYPDLEAEDVRQALSYAAALANEKFILWWVRPVKP